MGTAASKNSRKLNQQTATHTEGSSFFNRKRNNSSNRVIVVTEPNDNVNDLTVAVNQNHGNARSEIIPTPPYIIQDNPTPELHDLAEPRTSFSGTGAHLSLQPYSNNKTKGDLESGKQKNPLHTSKADTCVCNTQARYSRYRDHKNSTCPDQEGNKAHTCIAGQWSWHDRSIGPAAHKQSLMHEVGRNLLRSLREDGVIHKPSSVNVEGKEHRASSVGAEVKEYKSLLKSQFHEVTCQQMQENTSAMNNTTESTVKHPSITEDTSDHKEKQ